MAFRSFIKLCTITLSAIILVAMSFFSSFSPAMAIDSGVGPEELSLQSVYEYLEQIENGDLTPEEIFILIDDDKDGYISKSDFDDAILTPREQASYVNTRLRKFVNFADRNADDYLTTSELKKAGIAIENNDSASISISDFLDNAIISSVAEKETFDVVVLDSQCYNPRATCENNIPSCTEKCLSETRGTSAAYFCNLICTISCLALPNTEICAPPPPANCCN